MIDKPNNFDIINPSTKGTDFLCQNSPLVCAVELHRSSGRRRNRAFLLEGKMKFKKGMTPWNKGKKFAQFSGENHPNFRNLKDKQFGSLHVMSFYGKHPSRGSLWMCQCICGRRLTINSSSLVRGLTHSCGCLRGKHISISKIKHGMANTPTYSCWSGMKSRCYNPKEDSYKYYGGKGIKVCSRWLNSFPNFLKDMGKCIKGMSIDRIDSKKNYSPKNCQWLTKGENASKAMKEKYYGHS